MPCGIPQLGIPRWIRLTSTITSTSTTRVHVLNRVPAEEWSRAWLWNDDAIPSSVTALLTTVTSLADSASDFGTSTRLAILPPSTP